jgi:hypothetical protein
MFSAKEAAYDITNISSAWIFEYYLKLDTKLTGQAVKLKSVFNPNDKNPSFNIYISSHYKNYWFKCFSTGLTGNAISLVMYLYNLSYDDAIKRISSDYQHYVTKTGRLVEEQVQVIYSKWEMADYEVRNWNKIDVGFWSPYNIGSSLLEEYNVKPLAKYTMQRDGNQYFTINGQLVYGYFTANGELYKIYQPANPDKKFFNIMPNYLQGWDQIQGKSALFICSSLKDIMTLKSLKIEGDYIAPSSEISNIDSIIHWINAYPKKYTIFDNDQTGIQMMQKYNANYGLPYLHINLSKDISDSVKDHGAKTVRDLVRSML